MKPELCLEVVWNDEYVMHELEIRASNGEFSGITHVDFYPDELTDFGERVAGFPKVVTQTETFLAGQRGNAFAKLQFQCTDKAGHVAVMVELHGETGGTEKRVLQTVLLKMPFEPAAVDSFSIALVSIGRNESGKAVLSGTTK